MSKVDWGVSGIAGGWGRAGAASSPPRQATGCRRNESASVSGLRLDVLALPEDEGKKMISSSAQAMTRVSKCRQMENWPPSSTTWPRGARALPPGGQGQ
jgi:hypothetical protein